MYFMQLAKHLNPFSFQTNIHAATEGLLSHLHRTPPYHFNSKTFVNKTIDSTFRVIFDT